MTNAYLFPRKHLLCIAFVFAFGSICGVLFASCFDLDFIQFIHSFPAYNTSLFGVLAVSLAPLVATFLILHFGCSWLLHLICFFKAISWSFCSFLFLIAFKGAGWLVQFLCLFPSTLHLFIIAWFSLHYIAGYTPSFFRNCIFVTALVLSVSILDYYILSPSLAYLIMK